MAFYYPIELTYSLTLQISYRYMKLNIKKTKKLKKIWRRASYLIKNMVVIPNYQRLIVFDKE